MLNDHDEKFTITARVMTHVVRGVWLIISVGSDNNLEISFAALRAFAAWIIRELPFSINAAG
jgi:hypothetical protein